jgi:hypothetical protein
MRSLKSSSLKSKSLIACGILVVSLGCFGNAAMAAGTQAHKAATTAAHVVHPRHTATAARYRVAQPEVGLPNVLQALFGGWTSVYGAPAHSGGRTIGSARDTGGYDPTFDAPSPPVAVDNSQSQAAIDAADQAMQQEDQNLQDLDASIAAAEQQNDAANAATLQTEINAGM